MNQGLRVRDAGTRRVRIRGEIRETRGELETASGFKEPDYLFIIELYIGFQLKRSSFNVGAYLTGLRERTIEYLE